MGCFASSWHSLFWTRHERPRGIGRGAPSCGRKRPIRLASPSGGKEARDRSSPREGKRCCPGSSRAAILAFECPHHVRRSCGWFWSVLQPQQRLVVPYLPVRWSEPLPTAAQRCERKGDADRSRSMGDAFVAVQWTAVGVFFVCALFCGYQTIKGCRSRTACCSMRSHFLGLCALSFAIKGAVLCLYIYCGGCGSSPFVWYLFHFGFLCLYMGIFSLGLLFVQLAYDAFSEGILRLNIRRNAAFFAVFGVCMTIDGLKLNFEGATETWTDIGRIGLHCVLSGTLLFAGALLLQRKMLARMRAIIASVEKNDRLTQIRRIATVGTAFLLVRIAAIAAFFAAGWTKDPHYSYPLLALFDAVMPCLLVLWFVAKLDTRPRTTNQIARPDLLYPINS